MSARFDERIISVDELHAELGRVESAWIGPEDHGIFTFWVTLRFAGSGQGFGGLALDEWNERAKRRVGSGLGMELLMQLHRFFGIDRIERAKGQAIYALRDQPMGSIVALQRIEPDGGAVFYPAKIVAEWNARGAS